MTAKKTTVTFLVLLLIFAGCKNHSKTTSADTSAVRSNEEMPPVVKEAIPAAVTGNDQQLKNRKWQLFIMNGKEKAPYPLTLVFKDSTFGGMGVCNSYGGKIKYSSNSGLQFSQLSSTEMACEGLEFELRYFQFLPKVQTYRLHSDTLLLYDKSGMLPAMFLNIH